MNYWGKTKLSPITKSGQPRKGRYDRRVLTPDQVMAMRRGDRDYKEVAQEAGVTIQATWFAMRGYSYKELPTS